MASILILILVLFLGGPAIAGPVGHIQVSVDDGASYSVFLDGEDQSLSTPATLRDVPVGAHTIQVFGPDCKAGQKPVNVLPGQVLRVTVSTSAVGAFVVAHLDPPGARLFLDGTPLGVGPELSAEIPCGHHVLLARAPGHVPESREVDLAAGSAPEESFHLLAQDQGRVSVLVTPADADIYVDGSKVGSGSTTIDLDPGQHKVGADAEGAGLREQVIDVTAGDNATVEIDLSSPEPGPALPEAEPVSQRGGGAGWLRVTGGSMLTAAGVAAGGYAGWLYFDTDRQYQEAQRRAGNGRLTQSEADQFNTWLSKRQKLMWIAGGTAALLATGGIVTILVDESGAPLVGVSVRW